MPKKSAVGCLITLVVLLASCSFIVVLIMTDPGPKASPTPLTWEERRKTPLTDEEIAGPIGVCQEFVKDQLQAPSTAEFPWSFDDYHVNRLIAPENFYNVEGHFDAQNTFGAMIRAGFGCKVENVGNERWRLINADIRE
jgi:hypothetical protein